jgi:hypothetical protein
VVQAGQKVPSDQVAQGSLRGLAVQAVRRLSLAGPCRLAPPKRATVRLTNRAPLVGRPALPGRLDREVHRSRHLLPDRGDYAYSEQLARRQRS